jgi:predicted HTH transcriptional regulator
MFHRVSINADKVRELATRGERSTLDYKRDDYAWGSATANAEFAKDIMAMVNAPGPSAEPAYILLGVDDDGTIGTCQRV